jgi:hypothetical protein
MKSNEEFLRACGFLATHRKGVLKLCAGRLDLDHNLQQVCTGRELRGDAISHIGHKHCSSGSVFTASNPCPIPASLKRYRGSYRNTTTRSSPPPMALAGGIPTLWRGVKDSVLAADRIRNGGKNGDARGSM